jgi:hypothetical protein
VRGWFLIRTDPPCRDFGYHAVVTEMTTRPLLFALPPTAAELADWHALSREEQLARFREALQASDAGCVSKATMADVLAAGRRGLRLSERLRAG